MQRSKKFFVIAVVAVMITVCSTGMFLPSGVFAQTIPSSTAAASTTTNGNPNASVAAAVQSYFADIPVMVAIAKCESGLRQFANDGAPLYAGTDDVMVGVFQIDSSIHTAPALALGFDITTLAGNLGYARYLYGAEGTEPWISSYPCWGNFANASATSAVTSTTIIATTTAALTLNLSLGSIDPQVLILQQLLNQAGFTLATSGPGSPGNETTKFGALTYAALKKFQCAQGIVCSGDEATTGYGLLNAATRTALLAVTGEPASSDSTSTTVATTTAVSITTAAAIVTTTTASMSGDDPNDSAEVAELQSRVAALVVILDQLEAELAARVP